MVRKYVETSGCHYDGFVVAVNAARAAASTHNTSNGINAPKMPRAARSIANITNIEPAAGSTAFSQGLAATGGLAMSRDGTGRPWVGKEEQLTRAERKSREIIERLGCRKELAFTSFGRHGGATESMTFGLTERVLLKKS
jgi:hypothetical protein